MAKILLVVIVFAAVYFVLRAYARSIDAKRSPQAVPDKTEDMVRCAYCGVHLPRSDSVASNGQTYCSDEHRQLHGP